MTGLMGAGIISQAQSNSSNNSKKITITGARALWWFAMVIQTILAINIIATALGYFSINPYTVYTTSLIAYLAITIWAFFLFKDAGVIDVHDVRKLGLFISLSALYVFFPVYSYLVEGVRLVAQATLADFIAIFIYVVFPIWPYYIANLSEDDYLRRKTQLWINIAIILLIIIFIFSFASKLDASTVTQAGGRFNSGVGSAGFTFLVDKSVEIYKNLKKMTSKVTFTNFLNSTGLNYYTGTVDENEKAPVGLYIDNVRPSDKYFFTNNPVTIWADIRGKSFNEKLVARPECFIDKNPAFRAKANPEKFEFFGEDQDTLDCTFASLPKGTHNVIVAATFEFETWGYVTYTFVDQELDRAMQSQGKDINSELDIPKMPQAVFTNGPVFLGMGAQLDMPIGIDVIKNNRDATVGVQIDNKWSDGEPAFIKSFELGIPDDFQLYGCDRWYPANQKMPTRKEDSYNYYVFLKEELEDERVPFKSVTCRVHVIDPAKFLAGTQKVQRTFLGKAKYSYTLKKSITVVVRE